jgi:hypothetical protein
MTKPPEIGEQSRLGVDYLEGRLAQKPLAGEFRPSRREDVTAIDAASAEERRLFVATGLGALRRGEVAYGVLAAGASTRMNLADVPTAARRLLEHGGRQEIKSKAMVPVVEVGGRVYSFLDLFVENVIRLSRETTTACPALVLVSESNAAEIESRLDEFGDLPAERRVTFRQELDRQIVATARDVERARNNFASERDLETALELSRRFAGCDVDVAKPAGHGEFLHQLVSSGTLRRLLARGVRYVGVRNIDNIGALFDDRWIAILGRMIESAKRFVVEVSRRPDGPAGKGGALVVRPSGDFELAEDPSFEGTGVDPRASYYINDATAIFDVAYLFRIYQTSADEIAHASGSELAAIAERGRRRFPVLIDVKPVRLSDGTVVGAFVRETNLWQSTGVEPGLGVDAVGVSSVKDIEDGFERLSPAERRARGLRVRFAATKKWEDYEGINAQLAPYIAERVLSGQLVDF